MYRSLNMFKFEGKTNMNLKCIGEEGEEGKKKK